jgi:CPA1 family monovalent cation:H+ antiporter
MPTCQHLDRLSGAYARSPSRECAECVAMGSTWVHLRQCQTCGNVACCDMSPNKHATKHFHDTHHPVMRSQEGREDWAWCYVDKVEYDPVEDWDREGATLD